jgi:ATP-dependent DNA helicase RecQ
MPPYVICHDSTLKLIASKAPADIMALGRIKGMGPAKVSQYGETFLAAIRESND